MIDDNGTVRRDNLIHQMYQNIHSPGHRKRKGSTAEAVGQGSGCRPGVLEAAGLARVLGALTDQLRPLTRNYWLRAWGPRGCRPGQGARGLNRPAVAPY